MTLQSSLLRSSSSCCSQGKVRVMVVLRCACGRDGRGTSGSDLMGPVAVVAIAAMSGVAIVARQGGYGDHRGYSLGCFGPSLVLIQILGVDCFQSRSRVKMAPFHEHPRHTTLRSFASQVGLELRWFQNGLMPRPWGVCHCCR